MGIAAPGAPAPACHITRGGLALPSGWPTPEARLVSSAVTRLDDVATYLELAIADTPNDPSALPRGPA